MLKFFSVGRFKEGGPLVKMNIGKDDRTRLNPIFILGGLVAVVLVVVVGAIWSQDNVAQIIGFGTMIAGTLLMMLKQDQDTHALRQRIEESDQRTTAAKDEVVEKVQEKGTEVKAALRESSLSHDQKLGTVARQVGEVEKKVETVVKQTNGPLHQKLDEIAEEVKEVKSIIPSPDVAPGKDGR